MHKLPEHISVITAFRSVFKSTPTESVWQWADREVFFDEKQTAEMPRYDSRITPWTRVFQDLILDPDTHEGVFMKSSQTGVSEAAINDIKYMPEHLPGNVLYAINSREKAADVANIRLGPGLRRTAGAQISEDPDDFSTLTMRLKNMIVKVTGSGSPSPFRETWYRLVVLDEPEDHEVLPDGTTYDLSKSRFTTVSDYTMLVIGKPQEESQPFIEKKSRKTSRGIMHDCFLRGTQERFMLPCPHCGTQIELLWDHLQYSHCQGPDGEWDFQAVENDTWYRAQCCGGRIEESAKYEMVQGGEWIPRPKNERMLLKNKPVAAEPGVRSFHISDLYSIFPTVSWGKLAIKWISCAIVNPNQAKQDDFRKNHLGLPVRPKELHIVDSTINGLRGGITEMIRSEVVKPDGSIEMITRTEVLGERFSLCYDQSGRMIATLPVDPVVLGIAVDKQAACYKWTVLAYQMDGQSWLIDYGQAETDKQLLELRRRPYFLKNDSKPRYIAGGVIDRAYRPKIVYQLCQKAQKLKWALYPVLGWGSANERYLGKSYEEKTDYLDGGKEIKYYSFHDHSVKIDFYFGTIGARDNPRLWLPDPVPADIMTELTSEYWDATLQRFVHPEDAPPNDYGDTLKMHRGILWPVWSGVLTRRVVVPPVIER